MDLYKTADVRPDGYTRKVFHHKGNKYVLVTYNDEGKIRASIFHTNGRKVSTELSDRILADMKATVENVKRTIIKVTQGDN